MGRVDVAVGATTLTAPFDIEWSDVANRIGSFGFALTNGDAQIGSVDLGDTVTMTKDGVDAFYGVVESIRKVDADDGEIQLTTFEGRSTVAELEKVRVVPPFYGDSAGYGQTAGRVASIQPWDRVRLFGWPDPKHAGALGAPGEADNLTIATDDRPEGWPDPSCYWVGDSGGSVDTLYLAAQFDAGDVEGRRLAAYVAAKDEVELYCQGVLIHKTRGEEADPAKCHRIEFNISPDLGQVFTVKVRRVFSSNAEFMFSSYDPDSASFAGSFALRTLGPSQAWAMWADPATPPGTTPGEIVLDIAEEWEARNSSLGWTFDFDADEDSNGDPWPVLPIFPAQVGESLIDVLDRLSAGWVEWGVVPGAGPRVLSMWTAPGVDLPGGGTGAGRGTASGITLTVGTNVLDLIHEATL